MKKILVVLTMLMMACSCDAFAGTEITVDLEKHPELAAQLLANKATEGATGTIATVNSIIDSVDVQKMQKWGVSAAAGLKAICDQLSLSVNDFIETDVGKLTALAIFWKIAGDNTSSLIDNLWHIGLGFGLYFFCITVLFFHYRSKHGVKKFKEEGTKKNYFVPRYAWPEEANLRAADWRWETWSQFWHTVIFFVITVIFVIIVY